MNTEPSTIEMDHGGCVLPCLQASEDALFEPLLGVQEAAELLRCHSKTVQALARAGSIPCFRMGKYWRFRASTLDAWVREGLESDHQSRRVN
jgi:excisionase family DNA binding protein